MRHTGPWCHSPAARGGSHSSPPPTQKPSLVGHLTPTPISIALDFNPGPPTLPHPFGLETAFSMPPSPLSGPGFQRSGPGHVTKELPLPAPGLCGRNRPGSPGSPGSPTGHCPPATLTRAAEPTQAKRWSPRPQPLLTFQSRSPSAACVLSAGQPWGSASRAVTL